MAAAYVCSTTEERFEEARWLPRSTEKEEARRKLQKMAPLQATGRKSKEELLQCQIEDDGAGLAFSSSSVASTASFNRSFHKLKRCKRKASSSRSWGALFKFNVENGRSSLLGLLLAFLLILLIVFQQANANKNHHSTATTTTTGAAAAASIEASPSKTLPAKHRRHLKQQSLETFVPDQDDYSPRGQQAFWPFLAAQAAASGGKLANGSEIYVKVGALLEESDHEQANMFIRTIKMINERKDLTIRQLLNLSTINGYSNSNNDKEHAAGEFNIGALESKDSRISFNGKQAANVKLEPMIEFLANLESALEADSKVCQLIESGCSALLGPTEGASIQHVQSICDNIEIPYFELRPFLNSAPASSSGSPPPPPPPPPSAAAAKASLPPPTSSTTRAFNSEKASLESLESTMNHQSQKTNSYLGNPKPTFMDYVKQGTSLVSHGLAKLNSLETTLDSSEVKDEQDAEENKISFHGKHDASQQDRIKTPLTFQTTSNSNNKLEQLTLNLYPPAYLLTSAYMDLIYAWNWSSFAIVYEDGSSMIKLQDLFRESSGTWTSKWQIKLFQFQQPTSNQKPQPLFHSTTKNSSTLNEQPQNDNNQVPASTLNAPNSNDDLFSEVRSQSSGSHENWNIRSKNKPLKKRSSNYQVSSKHRASFRDIFWQIKSIGETNVILDVKTEHLAEALKNAQQVGCMTERFSYLITSLDLHTIDLEDFKYSRTRLTSFSILQLEQDSDSSSKSDEMLSQKSSSFNPQKSLKFGEQYLDKLDVHVIKPTNSNGDNQNSPSQIKHINYNNNNNNNNNNNAQSNIKWPQTNNKLNYKLSPSVTLDKSGSFMDPPSEVYQRDWARKEQLASSPASMGVLPSLDRDNEQRLFEFFVQQQEKENLTPRVRLTTASAMLHDSLILYMLGLNELDPTGDFLTNSKLDQATSKESPIGSCSLRSSLPWIYGSSLVNYMRRANFTGLTGSVSFDQSGLRTNFKLNMLGMAPEFGLVKVGEWRSDNIDDEKSPKGQQNTLNDPYRTPEGEKKSYDQLSAVYESQLRELNEKVARGEHVSVPYKKLISSAATREAAGRSGFWASSMINLSQPSNGLFVNEIIFERLYKEQQDQVDTLIVTTKLSQPYFMLKETPNKLEGNDQYEGFVVDLIHELSKLVNFKYRWREATDKKYGSKTIAANGSVVWNGMIGEIVRGQADLAIVDLTITAQREEAVDFTLPFMNTGISILFKKPTTKVTTLFSFLSPFSSDVWAYVLAAYCGISAILFFVGHLSPYEWADPNPCRHSAAQQQQQQQQQQLQFQSQYSQQQSTTLQHQNSFSEDECFSSFTEPIVANLKNQFSLLNSFWFTIGSLMQQGSDLTPRSMSTRTIAGIWYFFTLIMISSYTANLAAFLTVEKVVYPIENVRDLSQQEEIRYGCVESGSTCTFFSDSQIDTYKKINEGMKRHRTYVRSNDDGQKRVEEGKFAFFMESASIEYIIERNCNLTQIGGLLDSKGYGLATSKKSRLKRPYRTLLSEGILHLQETGMLHTLKNRWWKERRGGGTCTDDGKGGGVTELSLANVGGVFVVLLGGLGISFLVAIAEFMWRSRRSGSSRDRMCEEMMSDLKFALACKRSTKPVKTNDLIKERKLNTTTKGVRRQLARQASSLQSSQSNNRQLLAWQQSSSQEESSVVFQVGERSVKKTQTNKVQQFSDEQSSKHLNNNNNNNNTSYPKGCNPILLHAMITHAMLMKQQTLQRQPELDGLPNCDQLQAALSSSSSSYSSHNWIEPVTTTTSTTTATATTTTASGALRSDKLNNSETINNNANKKINNNQSNNKRRHILVPQPHGLAEVSPENKIHQQNNWRNNGMGKN